MIEEQPVRDAGGLRDLADIDLVIGLAGEEVSRHGDQCT